MLKNGLVVLAVVAAALQAGCGKKPQAGPGGPGGPMAPEVEVVTVKTGEASMTQDLPGRLEAVRTAEIRARVEGIIEKRLFVEGSDVNVGQVLYRLDDRTYRAAVASAQAEVSAAQAIVNRYKPLVEAKAVSQQEMDQADAALKRGEANLAQAQLNVENANIPAPISGRIGRSLVTEGALVGKGEATHLATIEQLDPLYVNFTRSSSEMLGLQKAVKAGRASIPGQNTVDIVLEDGSVYPLKGKLLFSDMSVDPDTGSVSVRASLPNPQHQLLPGMFVRVRFAESVINSAILVPQAAVQFGPQGNYVLAIGSDNKVEPRHVEIGASSDGKWIINSGLAAGDRVIVQGIQKVGPGIVVTPVESGAAPANGTAPTKPAAPDAPKVDAPKAGAGSPKAGADSSKAGAGSPKAGADSSKAGAAASKPAAPKADAAKADGQAASY